MAIELNFDIVQRFSSIICWLDNDYFQTRFYLSSADYDNFDDVIETILDEALSAFLRYRYVTCRQRDEEYNEHYWFNDNNIIPEHEMINFRGVKTVVEFSKIK
jgi:hypothetical protein